MEYSNSQIRDLIAEYVHSLRDRQVLCRRLIDGATIDALAAEFDLSPSQVKRIIRKNEEALFKHLPK
jgi:Sigma-70, region 4.